MVFSAAAATLRAALHSSGYSLYSTVTPAPPPLVVMETLVSVQLTYSGFARSAMRCDSEIVVVLACCLALHLALCGALS